MTLRYVQIVRDESARFLSVMTDTDPATQVPSCPDWDAADLVWHLGEVQWFWESVVRRDLTDEDDVEALARHERPLEYVGLLAHLQESSAQLVRTLGSIPASAQRYMWTHDPALHTVGYISRRQALEVLIHRIDAELTVGAEPAPIAAELAVDGIDEVVDVMRGGAVPDWATFTPAPGRIVELEATDTGDRWPLQLGTFSGVTPNGVSLSEHGFQRLEAGSDALASATIRGMASDLLRWLWNRPAVGDIERTGDADALMSLDYAVNEDID